MYKKVIVLSVFYLIISLFYLGCSTNYDENPGGNQDDNNENSGIADTSSDSDDSDEEPREIVKYFPVPHCDSALASAPAHVLAGLRGLAHSAPISKPLIPSEKPVCRSGSLPSPQAPHLDRDFAQDFTK